MPMDPIQSLRMRNLLRGIRLDYPEGQEPIESHPGYLPQPRSFIPEEAVQAPMIREPEPPSTMDRLRTALANVPTREEHKPGLLRKIVAGAAGASEGYFRGPSAGIKAGLDITELPFRRAQEQYEGELGAAKGLYDIESLAEKQELEQQQKERELDIRSGTMGAQTITAEKRPTFEQTVSLENTKFDNELRKAEAGDTSAMERLVAQQDRLDERQKASLSASMDRVLEQQTSATERTEMTQEGAMARTEATNIARKQIANLNRKVQQSKVLPTQQKAATELAITKVISQNPQWKDLVSTDNQGRITGIKTPEELGGTAFWPDDPTKIEDAANRINQFLAAIKREEKRILEIGGGGEIGEDLEDVDFYAEEMED